MKHELDRDACCIHCGLDACDFPRGEQLPPCPVCDVDTRAENRRRNPIEDPFDITDTEMLQAELGEWEDIDGED